MKKALAVMSLMLVVLAMGVAAEKPEKLECTTIQDGVLMYGQSVYGYDIDFIPTGYIRDGSAYDGYNYQAHMYNGDYFGDGSRLMMKWSDSWLSNKDCDGDDVLDRHLGFETYIGSGAWLTNHWFNEYVADDVTCYQEEFIKIVAVPEDAANVDGFWYDADGVQIGESIWGQFAIIQYNWYDSCDPEGSYTMHEAMPGLGNW